jgi:hypothetical protein
MNLLTETVCFCPIQWIRIIAWSSTAGFLVGSCIVQYSQFQHDEGKFFVQDKEVPGDLKITTKKTFEAAVRFIHTPAAFKASAIPEIHQATRER